MDPRHARANCAGGLSDRLRRVCLRVHAEKGRQRTSQACADGIVRRGISQRDVVFSDAAIPGRTAADLCPDAVLARRLSLYAAKPRVGTKRRGNVA